MYYTYSKHRFIFLFPLFSAFNFVSLSFRISFYCLENYCSKIICAGFAVSWRCRAKSFCFTVSISQVRFTEPLSYRFCRELFFLPWVDWFFRELFFFVVRGFEGHTWNRGKCRGIHTYTYIHTYTHIYIQKSQMKLASGTGNPGWSRTRPKLVCCQAWWLSSNNLTMNLLTLPVQGVSSLVQEWVDENPLWLCPSSLPWVSLNCNI